MGYLLPEYGSATCYSMGYLNMEEVPVIVLMDYLTIEVDM